MMRIKTFTYVFIFLGLLNGVSMCSESGLKSDKTTAAPFKVYTAVSPQKSSNSNVITLVDKTNSIFGVFRGTGLTEKDLEHFNDPLINKAVQQLRLLNSQEVAQWISKALPKKIIEKQHDIEKIKQLFVEANGIILKPGPTIRSMGSTSATIAHSENNILYTYSVGDATIYLLEEGKQLELLATAQRSDANIGSPAFTIDKLQVKQTPLNVRKNYILVMLAPGSYINEQEDAQKIIAQTAASLQTIAENLTGLAKKSEKKDLTALVIKLQAKFPSSQPAALAKKAAIQIQPKPIASAPLDTSSRIKFYAQAMVKQTQSWGNYVSERLQAGLRWMRASLGL